MSGVTPVIAGDTVNTVVLVAMPLVVETVMRPVVAPVGTLAII